MSECLRKSILLIHPPVSKPGEPPAGIARLSGALHSKGIRHTVFDANLEGLLNLMSHPPTSTDTWTHRAFRNFSAHLQCLKSWSAYRHFPRYKRAVLDLNRILHMAGISGKVNLSLANYEHRVFSPLRSRDLIQIAERPKDDPFFAFFDGKLRQVLERDNPSAVGFSVNFLSQALSAFAMIGFLKKYFPALPIVLGGSLVNSWVRRPGWKDPFAGLVDSVIAGRGEVPLLSMLGVKPATEMHGQPDYDGFPEDGYFAPGFILPYSASSGCYWNRCQFCPEKAEGNPYQPVPVSRAIQDLKALITRMKPALVHFLDNAISPALLNKLIDDPLGVPWYGFARLTDHLADMDFCLALKRSGCVMLQVGLESGDPRVLEKLDKGIDLKVASPALKNLKKAGVKTYVYLLFGTPAEGESEARRTLEFTIRHSDQIGFLNLAIFNLPSHGPEAEGLHTQKFYDGDLSFYSSFWHPRGWKRNLVRAFLEKDFKRHPAISPILRRDPPIFTSNHAPFFAVP